MTKRFQPSRREFLRTSALAGVGFWVAGTTAAESTSPNERVRIACIGVGGSKGGEDTADAARVGDIVALCDIDGDFLGKAGERYPKAKRFSDWRKMLDAIPGEFDAITVTTPDHSHAVIAAAAMRLGKAAYVQKPLTHSLHEARTLGQIAHESKVATQMGNQHTDKNSLRQAAALIKAGTLGPVKEIYVWTNRPIWPQGVDRGSEKAVPSNLDWDLFLGPAQHRPFADNYHPFNWRGWWDFGTGALGDMACHTMNMPYMALNLRDPISVQAETSGHNRDSYPSKAKITYEFAATSDRPALRMYWYDGSQKPDRALLEGRLTLVGRDDPEGSLAGERQKGYKSDAKSVARRGFANSGALVIGEKGKLYAPGDYAENAIHLIDVDEVKVDYPRSPGHWPEFIRAIKGGEPAMSNFPNYASPLTETVLLGNLAMWVATEPNVPGKKVEWDAKTQTAKNAPEVAQLIKHEYRKGYTL